MHNNVLLNGEIIPSSRANLNAVSTAALYGRGVFTTVAITDGDAFLWEKHWVRLSENADRAGVDITGYSKDTVKESLDKLIASNAFRNGRARVTVFDTARGKHWGGEGEVNTALMVTTADQRPLPDMISLTVSPYPVNSASPLAGVKSCNYLENILAKNEASSRGFGEAVRLNERGEIASACMANVFWIKDGELFTPRLDTGCLAGTTREFVLENLECSEANVGINDLLNADAVFLTSSGAGVRRVSQMDERKLGGEMHEILSLPGMPN